MGSTNGTTPTNTVQHHMTKPLQLDERQALILLDALHYSLKHRTDLHRTAQLTGIALSISLSARCNQDDLRQLLGEDD